MAVMSILFLIFLLHAGRKQSDLPEQSLRLSVENQGLADHLTEEKTRAEQLNAERRREMAANATKVRQILCSLLSNALMFTEQGRVEVKLRRQCLHRAPPALVAAGGSEG